MVKTFNIMDLTIRSKTANIAADDYKVVSVTLDSIDTDDLNTKEVAACVEIQTFFDAYGEDDIKAWVERNLDWFEE